jgi:non-canonical (house-cleaning) NTP pyrophosphatase
MEAFGSYDYEKPEQLPYTTEQFLKELPLAPTAPVGQLAGQAASFVPLNPAPLVRGAQKLGTMVGEGMAERVATGRPMLPSLLAEPQAAMFAVEPNVPRMNLLDTPPETMTSLLEVKPQAAVSDLGFYSAAEQAALNLQRNKGSGQAFLNDLLKAENVKKDELQWMGVDDFLKEKPNVTKQEVQDFIANNRVDVKEVQLGSKGENPYPYSTADEWQSAINRAERSRDFDEAERLTSAWEAYEGLGSQTKYQKYTLPGGENYREILMTLPEAMPNTALEIQQFTKRMETMRELQNEFANAGNMEKAISFAQKADDLQAYIKQLEKIPVTRQTENYQSSHFDEPNILAHIRVNDRVDADGKKMLLIEEIQSDWHQAGREKGYKSKESLEKWYNQNKLDGDPSFADLNSEQRNIIEQNRNAGMGGDTGVPDAPFKDTWYQLALKRALKYAADNGYERVGLTTGKQQADRFNLAKQVDHIDYRRSPDGTFELGIADINGDAVNLPKARYAAEELPSLVGKEVADKIVKGEGQSGGGRMTLRGLDLQVGGEGMKKYYDEIYPKFLDKYGKKWNARVGETQISTGDNAWNMAEQIKMRGISDAQWRAMSEADKLTLWNEIKKSEGKTQESIRYIDITPEMKGAVSKGQPLFAATPALPLGAQGLLGEPEKKKELSLLD